jgi:phosphoribosylaminoimidazole-succinocarboxamide synthase
MSQGFQGKEGQQMPAMSDEVVKEISQKYIHLYETITGRTFEPTDVSTIEGKVIGALK